MKRILLIVCAFLMVSLASTGQVIVTGSNGANGTYPNLTGVVGSTGAFAAINANDQTGMDIIIGIVSDVTTETGIDSLKQGNWKSLLIAPNGTRTVSGTVNGAPMITLHGADRVTIDGLNTGSNSLTIANLSTAATTGTSTIKFQADAIKNTLTNLTIQGSATVPIGTNGGTVYFGTATTTGNDTITISNCLIGAAGTNLPSKGIYANGTTTSAAHANNYIRIENCEIYDFFLATGSSAGIYALTGNTEWTIQNNKIYQKDVRTFTSTGTMYGIYFANSTYGNNIQILSNTIGYAGPSGTGTLSLAGTVSGSFYGINMTVSSTANAVCRIKYNIVSDIAINTASSATFYGIYNLSTASANTINIDSNIVRNIASTTITGAHYGIHTGGATNLTASYNTITNITRTATGVIYGIGVGSGTNCMISNNSVSYLANNSATGTSALYGIYTIGSPVNDNIIGNTITNLSSTSTAAIGIRGISETSTTGNKVIQNNSINNLSAGGGATLIGIYYSTASSPNPYDVSGNTIHTFSGCLNAYGIQQAASSAASNIYRNKIYGFTSANAAAALYGISVTTAGAATTISNNLIGDLNATAATGLNAVMGLNLSASSTYGIYYNTIRLNAVSSGSTFGSSCITFSSTATAVTSKNNILVNLSTPGTDGANVASNGISACVRRSAGTTGTVPANYTTSSDFNDYNCNPAGGTNNHLTYVEGTTTVTNPINTVAALKTFMVNRDQASIGELPNFLSTTGSDATYLHIDPAINTGIESGGNSVSGITVDYDGATRQGNPGYPGTGTSPDIGADEFEGLPAYTCGIPNPGNTVSSATALCYGQTITLSLQNPISGTGNSYRWQNSTNGTTYADVPGATSPTYSTVPTAAQFFRCIVTCQNGPESDTSNPVQVDFINSITSTTPGSRCGIGTVNLAASGSAGSIAWYAAALGGAPVGSGSPFTTPVINTTTTYYVGAETSSPANITLGAGASTGTGLQSPFYYAYGGTKTQYLIRASELTSAGLYGGPISSLSFEFVATGASFASFTLSMGHTSQTTLTTTMPSGLTPVYTIDTITPTAGIFTITFDSPFYWDGISNMIIQTCWSNNNTGGTTVSVKYDNPGYVSLAYYRVDNQTPAYVCAAATASGTSSARPKMIFAGQSICSSPRVAVEATVTPAPALTITEEQAVCNGAVGTIDVTSTLGDFNTYTWSPVTNLYTDAACTVPYVAMASASTVYVTSATGFSATYTCTATNTSTNCVNMATTLVTVLPGNAAVTASPSTLCLTGSSVISLSPSTGWGKATFQWQDSPDGLTYTNISGATGTSYTTPTLTVTRYYKLLIKNDLGTVCATPTDTVVVSSPELLTTTPGERCGLGSVVLQATGAQGIVTWYTSETGGAPIGTGSPFNTPVINTTTNYWVGVVAGGSSPIYVGPVSPTAQGGTIGSQTIEWGVYFTTLAPTTLGSVDIFPLASGQNGVIEVRAGSSSSGTLLATINYTTNVSGGATPQTVEINYPIPTPGAYTLYTSVLPSSGINRNTSGAVYPYTSSIANITGNGYSASYYMGLYNWKFGSSCSSARQMVAATVLSPPALSATGSQTICPDEVATINITSELTNYDTYTWSPVTNLYTDAACTVPYVDLTSATTVYAKSSVGGAITYTCSANRVSDGCADTALVAMTFMPAGATISANPGDICVSGTSVISLSPATGWGTASFQWQESDDNVNFTDISGQVGITYTTPTLTATKYYKLLIKNGAGVVCSSPQLTIAVQDQSITGVTNGERCGVGSVTLAATTSGGTPGWYAGETGGVKIGSGSPFNTPSIATTTTFYVGAEVISSGNAAVGAGATTSSTYSNPFYSLWSNTHTQHLIKAEELAAAGIAAGNLNSVALNVTSAGTLPMIDLSLKIATTTATDMSAFVSPAFTTVYTSASMMPVVGLNVLTFSTPFYWDGSSNIVLEFCHGNPASTATMSRTVKADATSYISSIKVHKSAATPVDTICPNTTLNKTTYSVRPQFTFNGQVICSSARSAVVATVYAAPALTVSANQTVCNEGVATLNVTSTPLSDYDTYTWDPVTNLYTDAGCTVPYTTLGNAHTVYAKSATTGNYSYICTATKIEGSCVDTAKTVLTVMPGNAAISSSPVAICVSDSALLSITPATGWGAATFQWQDSPDNITFTDIPGETGLTYQTPELSATRYFKAIIRNGSGVTCSTPTYTLEQNDPQLLGTTPGSRCGTGSVQLQATASGGGIVNWYASSTGGTSLGTGETFNTPSISTTTSYWAGAVAPGYGTTGAVGPVTNTFGSGSNVALSYYLKFDVLAPSMRLQGVHVYPGAVGNVVLYIANSSGVVLHTVTYPVTATGVKTYIPINFDIPNGTQYRIGYASGSGGVSMFRNDAGAVYPYTLPGIVSITGHSFSGYPAYYYYSYDWRVSTVCSSPLQEVVATVTTAPAITPTATPPTVCAGEVSQLNVTSSEPNYTYTWTPGNLSGATQNVTPSATTVYTVNASETVNGCVNSATVTVTVNPSPTDVIVTPASAYVGSIQQLTASSSTVNITWSPITGLYTDALATTPYAGGITTTVYANPTEPVTYTATATNASGCTKTGTCQFLANAKTLNIGVLLEGLYAGNGAMNEAMDDNGPHWGATVADHIGVQLNDGTTGAFVWEGEVSLNTSGLAVASVPGMYGGFYWITIKHRNSLWICSATPVSFAGATINYAFDDILKVYGDVNLKLMEEAPDYWAAFAGDCNGDAFIDSGDFSDVDNDASGFVTGYVMTDANGDSYVDTGDFTVIDNNNALFLFTMLPY